MAYTETRKSRAGVVYVTLHSERVRHIQESGGPNRAQQRAAVANTSKGPRRRLSHQQEISKAAHEAHRGGTKIAKHWDSNERARYATLKQHSCYGRRSLRTGGVA